MCAHVIYISNINQTQGVVSVMQNVPYLESLDLRKNPICVSEVCGGCVQAVVGSVSLGCPLVARALKSIATMSSYNPDRHSVSLW